MFLLFGGRSRSCRMQLGATCIKDGCLKKNNRMLHSANQEYESEQNPAFQTKISLMEWDEQYNTSFMATKCQKLGFISLQTVNQCGKWE